MYRNTTLFLLAVLAASTSLAHSADTTGKQPATAKPFDGKEFLKESRVGLDAARAIALKTHPGKITDEELEKEPGGSGLRYSFDIKDSAGTHEVGVDAKTGKVLEDKPEGANAD